jgi:hypothetical protein
MKTGEFTVEIEHDTAWAYLTRSFPNPVVDLHALLEWILEQVCLGCWQPRLDDRDEVTTLVLGKEAAIPIDELSPHTPEEYFRRCLMALHLNRLLAMKRESGAHLEDAGFMEEVRQRVEGNDPSLGNVRKITQFHCAFAMVTILKRVADKAFVFSAPAILGRMPTAVSEQLGEATRAFLYGLNRCAVVLTRATLEASLRSRIDSDLLARYRNDRQNFKKWNDKAGRKCRAQRESSRRWST